MTSAHPPFEHNPHVYDMIDPNVIITHRDVAASDEPSTETAASVTVTQGGAATTAPVEGGEPPSASQPETAASDGTDSSASSSPDATSDGNAAKPTPSPAPSAVNPFAPVVKPGGSTVLGATGTGTAQ
jgi:hypothetical protein